MQTWRDVIKISFITILLNYIYIRGLKKQFKKIKKLKKSIKKIKKFKKKYKNLKK
jgi:hypothetical protein